MDVAVVVNVDQQVSREILLLNPTVKDWNEIVQSNGCRIGREKFDPESMNFHYRFPAALPVWNAAGMAPAALRSVNES